MNNLVERIKKRIEKERAYDETAWETLADKGNREHQVVHSSRNSLYGVILKAIDEESAKEPQECEWKKEIIDFIHSEINRTTSFSEHDVLINVEMKINEVADKYNNQPQSTKSDLISRKALARELFYSSNGSAYPMRDCDNFPITISYEELRKVIHNQPQVQPMNEKICETCGYKVHSEAISKLNNCNDCMKNNTCSMKPKLGAMCRINCYQYTGKEV